MTIAHDDVRVDMRVAAVSTMSMAAALNLALADAIESDPEVCLLYTSPSPRDQRGSRMPSSA